MSGKRVTHINDPNDVFEQKKIEISLIAHGAKDHIGNLFSQLGISRIIRYN